MATDSSRRLHHATPAWVGGGAVFHIRLRVDREWSRQHSLTADSSARHLLESAAHYHHRHNWCCHLFLLMPDHLHALLSFPLDCSMSRTIGCWKNWHSRQSGIGWQGNYFDHRIRSAPEFQVKAAYIRQNPVARQLCTRPDDWPWVIDFAALETPSGTPAPTPD